MWRLFGKWLHPCAVRLIKTNLLSSKRGHFDLVYCSVLKPRSRNSWHHWPCISTFAAAGCTSCPSCLAQPMGERIPQHCQDSGRSICTHNAHTGPSWNASVFWPFLQESKDTHGTLDYKYQRPYPVLPVLFPPKRLASSFTTAILARIPVQSVTKGLASFLSACSSPQTFLIKIKFLQY